MKSKHQTTPIGFTLLFALLVSAAAPLTEPALPERAVISDIQGQAQSYSLSCESRSATDLLRYWGIQESETAFLRSLGKSDNPEKGFVGDVNGEWGQVPPDPYGVHAQPVAASLQSYGLEAEARYLMSLDELKAEIAAGRPVIVWVIGAVWAGEPHIYHTKDDQRLVVAAYEHTMLAVGYDKNSILLIDAGDGHKATYPLKKFLNSWAVLGNMAVTARPPRPEPQPDEGGEAQPSWHQVQDGDNLARIARKYNVNWKELAAYNKLAPPYVIHTGQVLQIP